MTYRYTPISMYLIKFIVLTMVVSCFKNEYNKMKNFTEFI